MFTASRRGEAEAGRPVRAVQGRAEEGVKRCGGEREEEDLQVRERRTRRTRIVPLPSA